MSKLTVDYRNISCPMKPLLWLTNCTDYEPTPLIELASLSEAIGSSTLFIKNETNRMGLGSFKALGGAYAVFSLAEEKLGRILKRNPSPKEVIQLSHDYLKEEIICCASAGNHGLSVAKGATILGLKCEVFISEHVPSVFEKRLQQVGAKVIRAGMTYEESMSNALSRSQVDKVSLITDSSWVGETYYPSLVMQGYSVLAQEMLDEFKRLTQWPTHVILQAGVGGMAAAITQHIRDKWPVQPEIMVVEPEWANCLQQSVKNGVITSVKGAVSNMGRLDCKEPSILAFDILKSGANRFVTITDEQATEAKNMLCKFGINTTTSGAAGLAGLMFSTIPSNARPLIIVTETQ
ncbi:diaminopropionate ammonia-lyase [Vibrio sagamiensis]|uniref:PLP-dependent lyase/thiolase n=1 Tax=Vibrio sagamiensis NBRC 104589 TaxID=1219064 RepID=A0A511QFA6_9VIBR|nr:diaminopropionate ammonia-lyase [Vibrio sagamiensis]PNQ54501.1 diaminopropionate ammonia-lyase [Vibrio agarivorans]GEM75836.1 PLP-dependent lyase/thiolase [Vibrio sagamiensis NBRC 104589]